MAVYRIIGKRAFDIVGSLAALLILSPLIAIVAMVVIFSMGSPILFRQQRVGKHGRFFTLIKFRTMSLNSELLGTVTVKGDPRITPVGAILRRFKIDELPQLVNVLIGDMSVIGPRPDVPEMTDTLTGEDGAILSIRPGLTGPASVIYAREETILAGRADPALYNREVIYKRKTRINRSYIGKICLCADMYWIYRTVLSMRSRKKDRR